MIIYTEYVVSLLVKNDNPKLLKNIFVFVEKLLEERTKDVEGAVTGCFLENIVNISEGGKFSPI
jgi:hypothetical protein